MWVRGHREFGLRQVLEEHFHGHHDLSRRIWPLLMFELWRRNYLARIQSRNENHELYQLRRTTGTVQ
jgi:hypothetical protein